MPSAGGVGIDVSHVPPNRGKYHDFIRREINFDTRQIATARCYWATIPDPCFTAFAATLIVVNVEAELIGRHFYACDVVEPTTQLKKA